MRFSKERVDEMKQVMKDLFDLEITDEGAQLVGIAVVNFILAKHKGEFVYLNLTEEEIHGAGVTDAEIQSAFESIKRK